MFYCTVNIFFSSFQTNDGTAGLSVDEIIKIQCEAQLDKMAPVSSTDPSFQTLSTEIMSLVCPNDCNNHGQCREGRGQVKALHQSTHCNKVKDSYLPLPAVKPTKPPMIFCNSHAAFNVY